jgi:hypothetical protein
MSYQPRPIPAADGMAEFLQSELAAIAQAMNEAEAYSITLAELHVEPARRFNGLTVLADGTDWNPGSGAGVYTFYGAAWHKLG